MKTTPVAHDEADRLSDLYSYHALDKDGEECFDKLTELACKLFDVPMAHISLIDEDRQWFKSTAGMKVKEVSRELTICTYTIMSKSVMEIKDATADVRFAENPMVQQANIKFYAGAPLISASKHCIGTFCILDTKPRKLSYKERLTMKIIAEHAVNLFEIRKKNFLLQAENQKAELIRKFVPMGQSSKNAVQVDVLKAIDFLVEQQDHKGVEIQKILHVRDAILELANLERKIQESKIHNAQILKQTTHAAS